MEESLNFTQKQGLPPRAITWVSGRIFQDRKIQNRDMFSYSWMRKYLGESKGSYKSASVHYGNR